MSSVVNSVSSSSITLFWENPVSFAKYLKYGFREDFGHKYDAKAIKHGVWQYLSKKYDPLVCMKVLNESICSYDSLEVNSLEISDIYSGFKEEIINMYESSSFPESQRGEFGIWKTSSTEMLKQLDPNKFILDPHPVLNLERYSELTESISKAKALFEAKRIQSIKNVYGNNQESLRNSLNGSLNIPNDIETINTFVFRNCSIKQRADRIEKILLDDNDYYVLGEIKAGGLNSEGKVSERVLKELHARDLAFLSSCFPFKGSFSSANKKRSLIKRINKYNGYSLKIKRLESYETSKVKIDGKEFEVNLFDIPVNAVYETFNELKPDKDDSSRVALLYLINDETKLKAVEMNNQIIESIILNDLPRIIEMYNKKDQALNIAERIINERENGGSD